MVLACAPTPQKPPQPPPSIIENCPPSLSSPVSRLAVLEPGRQSLQTELFGARLCVGAPIQAEAVTVSVTTEVGVNVVQQVRVELAAPNAFGTIGKASIDLQLDIPAEAKLVTFTFVVEPTIGVIRHTVPVARVVELPFTRRARTSCHSVVDWQPERSVCVGQNEAQLLYGDGGAVGLGMSTALAVTPAGLWSINFVDARFLPSDGGAMVLWRQDFQAHAIATLGDRVFVGTSAGVTELTLGRPSPFSSLGPPSAFPPTAMRVEPPELVIARQERLDRVPLATLRPESALPEPTHIAVLNFNSTAGLWRVEGQRIELTTDGGRLSLEVPHLLTAPSDVLISGLLPALTDETPLISVGTTADGRIVWLQPLEDLDAGTMTARYLVAPPGQVLGRADSEHVFSSGPDGVDWAPRR